MAEKKTLRPYLLLFGLCLLLYLPGQCSVPAMDRDEARFAQASRQMLEDADFVRIRFQDQPRHKKPVAIYWLQAAAVAAAGTLHTDALWPYRLPSMVGAVLAVMLTFYAGRRWLENDAAALLGAAFLAASVLLVVEAHLAKTDAFQLAAVCAAQGALWAVYLDHRRQKPGQWTAPMIFWAAMGVGILIKGPVLPMVSLLTVATLCAVDRRIRWIGRLHPIVGLIVAVSIASPWLVSIYRATDGAFFTEAVRGDLLPKLVGGHESHGALPGTYLVLSLATFWPASLFLWPAVARGFKERRQPAVRFLLAWLIPTWIAFEIMPTKLPHYVLPVYPALALLAGKAAVDARTEPVLAGRAARFNLFLWAAVTLVLAGAIVGASPALQGRLLPSSLIPAAAGLAMIPAVWRLVRRTRPVRAGLLAVALSAAVLAPAFGWVMPGLTPLWLSREAAAVVQRIETERFGAPARVAAADYHEPSLVFHVGTDTLLTDAAGAAAFLAGGGSRIAVVADSAREAFEKGAAEQGLQIQKAAEINGFNYTKGHWVTLRFYTAAKR